ncbi:MAG: hypothetical protein ACREXG_16360 [Polaromonas sp.]
MNTPILPHSLIEQILQIQQMEHGSLCAVGQGPNGPYYNLNSWENDQNCCRYVPQQKVPAVQQAIEGYHKYQQITQDYARQVIEKTRAELAISVKKKPRRKSRSRLKSSWRRRPKSSS